MENDLNDSQVGKVFKETQAQSIKEFEKFEEQRKDATHEIEKLLEMASSNKKGPSEKQKIFLVHLQDHLNKSLDTSLADIKRLTPSDESLEELKSIQAEASNTLAVTIAALSFMGPVIRGVNLAVDARNLMEKVFEKLPLMKNIVDKYNPIAAGLADEKIAKIQKIDAILNQENYKESMDKINKVSFHSSTPDLEKPLNLEEILPAEDRSLYYINGADEPAQLLQNNQDEFFDLLTHLAGSDDRTLLFREAALIISDWRKAIKIANIGTDFFNNFQTLGDEVLIPTAKNNATAEISITGSVQESTQDFFKSLDKTLEEDYTDLSRKLKEKVEKIKNEEPSSVSSKDKNKSKLLFDSNSNVSIDYFLDFTKKMYDFFAEGMPEHIFLERVKSDNYKPTPEALEKMELTAKFGKEVQSSLTSMLEKLESTPNINDKITILEDCFDILSKLRASIEDNLQTITQSDKSDYYLIVSNYNTLLGDVSKQGKKYLEEPLITLATKTSIQNAEAKNKPRPLFDYDSSTSIDYLRTFINEIEDFKKKEMPKFISLEESFKSKDHTTSAEAAEALETALKLNGKNTNRIIHLLSMMDRHTPNINDKVTFLENCFETLRNSSAFIENNIQAIARYHPDEAKKIVKDFNDQIKYVDDKSNDHLDNPLSYLAWKASMQNKKEPLNIKNATEFSSTNLHGLIQNTSKIIQSLIEKIETTTDKEKKENLINECTSNMESLRSSIKIHKDNNSLSVHKRKDIEKELSALENRINSFRNHNPLEQSSKKMDTFLTKLIKILKSAVSIIKEKNLI